MKRTLTITALTLATATALAGCAGQNSSSNSANKPSQILTAADINVDGVNGWAADPKASDAANGLGSPQAPACMRKTAAYLAAQTATHQEASFKRTGMTFDENLYTHLADAKAVFTQAKALLNACPKTFTLGSSPAGFTPVNISSSLKQQATYDFTVATAGQQIHAPITVTALNATTFALFEFSSTDNKMTNPIELMNIAVTKIIQNAPSK